ncbi:thiol-disulfide isomerase/thioredoxin [Bacillus pakistanensis]|uniref:Thiol-disulfide isomerase/thioredoxin n=1 Tax=Rossellomorea pakistanensis TaxID=992288 RepID=A0ABS2NE36_9BACI|nr:hypothetical protein [Bacillus pakistanensis]MBM7586009.1 thiol-disulfide isomerase/thioredoxin [Bacillus pakistanensis]
MSGIKFYSEYDMACGWELEKIIEKINNESIELEWGITDLIDFYNVLKYINIERFSDHIIQETSIDLKTYEKKIKQKIGIFVGCHKKVFINLYDEVAFDATDDFFEVLESYKLYKEIEINNFRRFLEKENVHIYTVLKFKILTDYFNEAVKDVLLSDPRNAETILSKYLKEDDLYLPPSLSETDTLSLIDKYIDSPLVNLNELRKIINFPTNKGLSITDKIKLHAKRKAEEEEERIFNNETGIKSGVMISYPKDQDEAILFTMGDRTADIKVSRNWIEENLDYPTLWNNFIYLFGFVDGTMRLELDSKKSESSALESAFRPQAAHLYYQSTSFYYKEMLSDAEIYSYVNLLNVLGVRLEEMIEWFFDVYVKDEFEISDFIVQMPSREATYFEKCRTILPELDRILKQYNALIKDGMIDQELIQMSSLSFKIKDIKSFNSKKYVYSSSDWYKTASFLLFSDQSSIFYLPNKEEYKNFFKLIISEKLTRGDFKEYQLKRMQWLFDNNLICESNLGHVEFVDQRVIYVLKELYYKEVMSYWHYPEDIQVLIEELSGSNLVDFETSLFSRNEQDYLDYYLNKSKFTNGHDIRNKYLHGTNTNDKKQYERDYYSILKLFVIIVIKINEDLCIKEDRRQK